MTTAAIDQQKMLRMVSLQYIALNNKLIAEIDEMQARKHTKKLYVYEHAALILF